MAGVTVLLPSSVVMVKEQVRAAGPYEPPTDGVTRGSYKVNIQFANRDSSSDGDAVRRNLRSAVMLFPIDADVREGDVAVDTNTSLRWDVDMVDAVHGLNLDHLRVEVTRETGTA